MHKYRNIDSSTATGLYVNITAIFDGSISVLEQIKVNEEGAIKRHYSYRIHDVHGV